MDYSFGSTGIGLPGNTNPQMTALQSQLNGLLQSFEQMNRAKDISAQAASGAAVSGMKFVDGGLEGAKNYLKTMGRNVSDAIFDKNEPVFYLLSVDANGIPAPIKIGRFTLEDIPEEKVETLTKKDLDDFKTEIRNIIASAQKAQAPETTFRVKNEPARNNKPNTGRADG